MMKNDLSKFVAMRFKEVRTKLKLKQTEVTQEIEKMLDNGEIYIKEEQETLGNIVLRGDNVIFLNLAS